MISKAIKATALCSIVLFASCKEDTKTPEKIMSDNLLIQEWTGPYNGVPAFDQISVEAVKSAVEEGMKLHLAEIEIIANNTEAPTFENTIVAMESAGKTLTRVFAYYGIMGSNVSSPEFRTVQAELAPKLSDFRSQISQNEKLFQRIKTVYDASQLTPLEPQAQRVVDLTYKQFEMDGANLNAEDKKRYAEINKELSTLYTDFANNVLHDEENYITYLNKDQLGGLADGFIKSAAKIATDKGQDGKYAITNTRSSIDPFLTYSTERELRKQVWENYYSRGDNNDKYDNKKIIAEILKLRKERVGLMGYKNFAEWRLQDRMAKTPENAMDLMLKVWPAAIARVKEEVVDMQTVANELGDKITIEPWDYRYYSEKVRKKKYDLDSDEVKQYLQLDKLTDAMFFTAGELFNYKFTPVPEGSVPVFHEDVHVWEVTDKDSGKHIGLWYLDPFSREGKRSGAWATTYRSSTSFEGETNVLASNNS
ncbi:MAG: M3 family metallopeptidase, partial [Xanthomarina sp.]